MVSGAGIFLCHERAAFNWELTTAFMAGGLDSNLDQRRQRPLSCHWTIPQGGGEVGANEPGRAIEIIIIIFKIAQVFCPGLSEAEPRLGALPEDLGRLF